MIARVCIYLFMHPRVTASIVIGGAVAEWFIR